MRKTTFIVRVILTVTLLYAGADNPSVEAGPALPIASSSTTDNGVSNAPMNPANKRILIVAQDNNGRYSTIRDAISNVQPGDTIQVKNGTYAEQLNILACRGCSDVWGKNLYAASKTSPITLMAYPGHKPILTKPMLIATHWFILDGFEFTGTNGGAGISTAAGTEAAGNITFRNLYIHDQGFQGLYLDPCPDCLIENSVFERNGLGPGNCTSNMWKGQNYSHCHGIYLSNGMYCVRTDGITIRRNKFINNSGSGIQFYIGSKCPGGGLDLNFFHSALVENNVFYNNAIGMYLRDARDSNIRNNTFVQTDFAKPQRDDRVLGLSIGGSQNNRIENNVFYGTWSRPGDWPIFLVSANDMNQRSVNYNHYFVNGDSRYTWSGFSCPYCTLTYRNFVGQFAKTTGWDINGARYNRAATNPGFVNMAALDFHLLAVSPLRNRGNNANCPRVDLDGKSRSDSACDVGAHGF